MYVFSLDIDFTAKEWQYDEQILTKEAIMPTSENIRKVTVFAAYQLGTAPNSKMIGDECKNIFEGITLAPTSRMILEVEAILAKRHVEEAAQGLVPIVHHFQLLSF